MLTCTHIDIYKAWGGLSQVHKQSPPFDWFTRTSSDAFIFCYWRDWQAAGIKWIPFISLLQEITSTYKGQILCEAVDSWGYIRSGQGTPGCSAMGAGGSSTWARAVPALLWCGSHSDGSEQGPAPNTYQMILENSRQKSERSTFFFLKMSVFYLKKENKNKK